MVSVLTAEMVKAVTASGSLAFPELVVTVMVSASVGVLGRISAEVNPGGVLATVTVDDGNGGQDSETFNATFLAAPRSARSSSAIGDYRSALAEVLNKEDLLDAWTLDELAGSLTEEDLGRKR